MPCADPHECVGGLCVPAYVLAFSAPARNATLTTATANFQVQLTRLDGGLAPATLTHVPLTIAGLSGVPSLTRDGGTQFSATITLPLVDGRYEALAGWDGGPTDLRPFFIDRVAPSLSLEVARLSDGGTWQRDQYVAAVLHSPEPLAPASLALSLDGVGQLIPVDAGVCAGRFTILGPNDVCGQLDLASPPLAGVTGSFTATATARDLSGNQASTSALVGVTRLRWRAALPASTMTMQVRAALALDREGNLLVGSEDSFNSGRLSSLAWADGTVRFATPTGAVQSIAVGTNAATDLAWVAMNTGPNSGAVRTYATDGGFQVSANCNDGARATWSAIALVDGGMNNGAPELRAAVVFSGNVVGTTAGALCSCGPSSGATCVDDADVSQTAVGAGPLTANNLVVSNAVAWFQQSNQRVGRGTLGPSSTTVLPSSGVFGGLTTYGTGLALGGSSLVATNGGSLGVPLAMFDLAMPAPVLAPASMVWSGTARAPTLLSGATLTGTTASGGNWLVSTPTDLSGGGFGAPAGVMNPASLGGGDTAAVIGTGPRVYVVRRDGALFVYEASATAGLAGRSPTWSATNLFPFGAEVLSHPTLDCSRRAAGRPGTLYVSTTSGQLVALIVDSQGLDPASPWPKWQRTAGNAGNPAAPLNPGCP